MLPYFQVGGTYYRTADIYRVFDLSTSCLNEAGETISCPRVRIFLDNERDKKILTLTLEDEQAENFLNFFQPFVTVI